MRLQLLIISVFTVLLLAGCGSQSQAVKESNMVESTEWRNWRGPTLNGVSTEKGLIESWSQEGENLIWKVPFIGRSTPIVMDGRVYVIGRTGEDVSKQEVVASYDAGTGEKVWEYRYNMRLTS
ncbi:MAG: pyrrolo-quinoline quinone, partial [Calditrichota bacterium]